MELCTSPEELKKLLEKGSVLLLDVRRKADFDADPGTFPVQPGAILSMLRLESGDSPGASVWSNTVSKADR